MKTITVAMSALLAALTFAACGNSSTVEECAKDSDCAAGEHCATSSKGTACVPESNPCPTGQTLECTGDAGVLLCVDLQTDANNCGACGVKCPANAMGNPGTCVDGACREAPCAPIKCIATICGAMPDECGGTIDCGACVNGNPCVTNSCSATCTFAGDACDPSADDCCPGTTCSSQNQCE